MQLHGRQLVYAILAAAGLVATWYFNLEFMAQQGGFGLVAFLRDAHANAAASSLSNDLTVAFLAFLVWLPSEARRLGMAHWWAYAVLGLLVAFAVSFPLFLLMRERHLARVRG